YLIQDSCMIITLSLNSHFLHTEILQQQGCQYTRLDIIPDRHDDVVKITESEIFEHRFISGVADHCLARNISKLVHTFLIAVYGQGRRLEYSHCPDDTAAETAQSYYCRFFSRRSLPLHDLSHWMTLILVAVSSLDIFLIDQEQPEQKTETR